MADYISKSIITPDEDLYIDGNLVVKGDVIQIETTKIINRLESNVLIINSDGSRGDDGRFAVPAIVLKYDYTGQDALGLGSMYYKADDLTIAQPYENGDRGLDYMRFSTVGHPLNGAIAIEKLVTMPGDTDQSQANIGVLEGNIWSGNAIAAYGFTSPVAITIASADRGGYTDIVPTVGSFQKAGDILTLNVNLDQTGVVPDIYGANASTTNTITVDAQGRLTSVTTQPIQITFDQIVGGTIPSDTANSIYDIFSAGTGLTFTGSATLPYGEFYITDTGVGPGTYGQADSVVVFDVNAQGQITTAANLLINIQASQVTDFESAVESLLGAVTVYDGTGWTAANLAYTPGVFTYTPPTREEVRNTLSATAPINYDPSNGLIGLDSTIAQDLEFTGVVDLSNATVPGFTITGNVDVIGNLNVIAKEDLYVQDNNIYMNVGNVVQDSHLVVDNSGVGSTGPNSYIKWNHTTEQWYHSNGIVEWALVRTTDDIIEGSNLWFEEQRVNNTIDAYLVAGDGIEFRTVVAPSNPAAKGIFADLGGNLEFDSSGQITTDGNVVTTHSDSSFDMEGIYDYVNGTLIIPNGNQTLNGFIYTELASNEAFIHMNGFNIPITPTVDFGRVDNGNGVIASGAIEIYAGTVINPVGSGTNANIAMIRGLKAGANTSIYYDPDPTSDGNVIIIDAEGLSQPEVRDSFGVANVSGFGNINYNSSTGVFSYVGVSSSDIRNQFNGVGLIGYDPSTGEISTSADQYIEWTFITDDGIGQEQAVNSQERVTIQGGTGINVTNAGNVITIVNTNTSADITSVIAGAGLTGGGASGDVTLDTGQGYGITVNPDNVEINVGEVRSLFSANTGIAYDNLTGEIGLDPNQTFASITTTSISTGAVGTAGTIEGQWTLTAGSTLEATYADLAEKYESDKVYEPGTVVVIGGESEVTACHSFMNKRVAGVVSANPAFVMNTDLSGGVMVALKGRVPVRVSGEVKKGDLLVTADELGCATSAGTDDVPPTAVVGIALKDSEMGWTEVKV